jgi:hypothetical protein
MRLLKVGALLGVVLATVFLWITSDRGGGAVEEAESSAVAVGESQEGALEGGQPLFEQVAAAKPGREADSRPVDASVTGVTLRFVELETATPTVLAAANSPLDFLFEDSAGQLLAERTSEELVWEGNVPPGEEYRIAAALIEGKAVRVLDAGRVTHNAGEVIVEFSAEAGWHVDVVDASTKKHVREFTLSPLDDRQTGWPAGAEGFSSPAQLEGACSPGKYKVEAPGYCSAVVTKRSAQTSTSIELHAAASLTLHLSEEFLEDLPLRDLKMQVTVGRIHGSVHSGPFRSLAIPVPNVPAGLCQIVVSGLLPGDVQHVHREEVYLDPGKHHDHFLSAPSTQELGSVSFVAVLPGGRNPTGFTATVLPSSGVGGDGRLFYSPLRNWQRVPGGDTYASEEYQVPYGRYLVQVSPSLRDVEFVVDQAKVIVPIELSDLAVIPVAVSGDFGGPRGVNLLWSYHDNSERNNRVAIASSEEVVEILCSPSAIRMWAQSETGKSTPIDIIPEPGDNPQVNLTLAEGTLPSASLKLWQGAGVAGFEPSDWSDVSAVALNGSGALLEVRFPPYTPPKRTRDGRPGIGEPQNWAEAILVFSEAGLYELTIPRKDSTIRVEAGGEGSVQPVHLFL